MLLSPQPSDPHPEPEPKPLLRALPDPEPTGPEPAFVGDADEDDDDDSLGLDLVNGRFFVECNIDGIAEDKPGEWTLFSRHNSLEEAVRACSAFMEMAKDCLGVPRVDPKADAKIERWIRVTDMWNEEVVLWVEDARLHIAPEPKKQNGSLRALLGLPPAEARPEVAE